MNQTLAHRLVLREQKYSVRYHRHLSVWRLAVCGELRGHAVVVLPELLVTLDDLLNHFIRQRFGLNDKAARAHSLYRILGMNMLFYQ